MKGDDAQNMPDGQARSRDEGMLDLLRDAGEQLRGEHAPAHLQARLERAYALRMRMALRAGDATRVLPAMRTWAFGLAAACGVAAILILAPWRSADLARPANAPIAAAAQPLRGPTETARSQAQVLAAKDDRNANARAIAQAMAQPMTRNAGDAAMPVAPAGHPGPRIEHAPAPSDAPVPARALAHAPPSERGDDVAIPSLSDLTALPSDPSALRIATTAPPLPRLPEGAPHPSLRTPTLAPPALPTMAPPGEAPRAPAPATLPPAQAVSASAARAIAITSPVRSAGTCVRFETTRPDGRAPASIRNTPAPTA